MSAEPVCAPERWTDGVAHLEEPGNASGRRTRVAGPRALPGEALGILGLLGASMAPSTTSTPHAGSPGIPGVDCPTTTPGAPRGESVMQVVPATSARLKMGRYPGDGAEHPRQRRVPGPAREVPGHNRAQQISECAWPLESPPTERAAGAAARSPSFLRRGSAATERDPYLAAG